MTNYVCICMLCTCYITKYVYFKFKAAVKNEENIDHRCVIQYFHLQCLSSANVKALLDSILGEFLPLFPTSKYWLAEY